LKSSGKCFAVVDKPFENTTDQRVQFNENNVDLVSPIDPGEVIVSDDPDTDKIPGIDKIYVLSEELEDTDIPESATPVKRSHHAKKGNK
jgi:hypothetical protein